MAKRLTDRADYRCKGLLPQRTVMARRWEAGLKYISIATIGRLSICSALVETTWSWLEPGSTFR